MPRVRSQIARKDYPDQGISKGDRYYKWCLRPGGRGRGTIYRSLTPPKPWQLTSSPFLQEQYQIEDEIQNLTEEDLTEDRIQEIAERVRALGEQAQESLDNMPEGLQESSEAGQMLQERIDNCESWADELEALELPMIEELQDPDDLEEPEEPIEEDYDSKDSYRADYEAYELNLEQYEDDVRRFEEQQEEIERALEELQSCMYPG